MGTKAALNEVETIAAVVAQKANEGPETRERLRAATLALRHWHIEALVRLDQRMRRGKR